MIMLGEMDRNVGHRTLLNVEVSFLLCNRYVYFVSCSVYRKLVVLCARAGGLWYTIVNRMHILSYHVDNIVVVKNRPLVNNVPMTCLLALKVKIALFISVLL